MDDLEMRRRCYAEPGSTDPDFKAELARQPAAARVARQVAQFDRELRGALSEVPMPAGLEDRILLRSGLHRQRRRRRILGAALAAGFVLGLGLSLLPGQQQGSDEVARMALAHVHGEPSHLAPTGPALSREAYARLLQRAGASLKQDIGQVLFAAFCPTPQGQALHLVVDNGNGPVTVLYLPKTQIALDRAQFSDARFRGLAMRAGNGTLALIGESRPALDTLAERLETGLSWPV